MTRILLADDDQSTLEFLRSAFSGPEVEVRTATSGAELVNLLADYHPFDLLVTDVAMPWMSGLQVIASARAAGVQVPAVVITGLTDPDIEAQVSRMDCVTLLRKPVGLEEIIRATNELFSRCPPVSRHISDP